MIKIGISWLRGKEGNHRVVRERERSRGKKGANLRDFPHKEEGQGKKGGRRENDMLGGAWRTREGVRRCGSN